MKDILHKVNIENNNFVCSDCGVDIPADIAVLGDDVIELGGAGTHWLPSLAYDGKAKPCLKATRGLAIIVCIICDGDGCEECGFNGVVSSNGSTVSAKQSEPVNGEVIELAPQKTEHEKMVARMGLQNFVNMREVTKPDGT